MNEQSLRDGCERRLPETLDFLRAMVGINSFTAHAGGVCRVGECIAEKFDGLGFVPEFVPPENPEHGSHLVLRRAPVEGAPTIALISHLDTVFPAEEERANAFAWRVEGDRIYGPGTNDIKGGTAAIHLLLVVLREVAPEVFDGANWVVLCNAAEEADSYDFGRVCRRVLPADARACLIFEADGGKRDHPVLVEARKGRATFRVEVEGRGAHAGGAHALGANAIVALSWLVGRLAAVTDYEAGLTVNVGRIEGGTVTNRVPHFAAAALEMRAFSREVYEDAKKRILALSGAQAGCRVTVRLLDETPPWPRNAGTDGLMALWVAAGAELGMPVESMTRGGLSDGNVLWEDFPTLDGLGPCGENSHCSVRSPDGEEDQEWVDAASFVPKTVLNALAIGRLLGGAPQGMPARGAAGT